jgi:hypothetical protein
LIEFRVSMLLKVFKIELILCGDDPVIAICPNRISGELIEFIRSTLESKRDHSSRARRGGTKGSRSEAEGHGVSKLLSDQPYTHLLPSDLGGLYPRIYA